jgi:hypothetical protein
MYMSIGRVVVALGVTLAVLAAGCGQQNEYLSEGKDILKSDKRRRVQLAVVQLRLAIEHENDPPATPTDERAEARYLLAYYDEDLSVEEKAELFGDAVSIAPDKFEDRLIEEALRDKYRPIREAVRLALAGRYATHPERIRRNLVDALHGKENRSRNDAAWVLGYLAAEDMLLRDGLIEALADRRRQTRLSAVIAIDELARHDQSAARAAIPALWAKVAERPSSSSWKFWSAQGDREHPEVRILAVAALGTIGATEQLLTIVANKGSSLRADAMEALIASGEGGGGVSVLLGLLEMESDGSNLWTSTQSRGRTIVQVR